MKYRSIDKIDHIESKTKTLIQTKTNDVKQNIKEKYKHANDDTKKLIIFKF